MNFVEMYFRVMIAELKNFLNHIVVEDAYMDYSLLPYEDRRHD